MIFENFSRSVLSSTISATQNQWDYLAVLVDAIRRYGAPEALVTDGGRIFYSTVALRLYEMLGIRKERIDPGEPWQNYAETLFSIQKRLADHAFSKARTWPEIQQIHQTWWRNSNSEHHYAHRERQDGRHSPAEVLRGALGRTYPEEVLSRVLYATQFTRHLDRHGYIRFQDWRLYGERGLAHQEVGVWVYEDTLKVEYQTVTLSTYGVERSDDHKRVIQVHNPRVTETVFRSPQLALFDLGPDEWLLYWKAPAYAPRRRHVPGSNVTQLALFEVPVQAKAAGAETASPFLRLVRAPQEHKRE